MSDLRRIALYWRTVRHLKPQQVIGRLIERIRRSVGMGMPADPPANLQVPSGRSIADVPNRVRTENRVSQDDISEGVFTFLSDRRALGRPVDWTPDASALWTFHLHYFNYLPGLDRSLRADLCREWVQANPVGSSPGWHPYPTSLRIINWCRAAPRESDILKSLYRQASYLYRHPETHLLGNHLLENARALVLAGHFFGDQGEARSWYERGLRIYRDETPEQVLEDGGHYERSPMYHALVLEGYLDVLSVIKSSRREWERFARVVRRMCRFLVAVTHPDGYLAQFNDSAAGEALLTSEIIKNTREILGDDQLATTISFEGGRSFEESGYYIYETSDIYCVLDGGAVGPDYLPGHAHADIFSYELSIHQHRWIIDTGVSTYESSSERTYERGTPAHNTVTVDSTNQVECWNAFRVARRSSPSEVKFQHTGGEATFRGKFDGYASLIGDEIVHKRRVSIDAQDQEMRVEDAVTGRGRHKVESRVHLHPAVEVQDVDGAVVRLRRGGCRVRVKIEKGRLRIDKGWHSPEFGIRREAHILVVQAFEELPVTCSYTVRY